MDPKDVVSKILGPVYVSSYVGAKDFEGQVVFVHHDIQWYTKGLHIPLLSKRPNSYTDRSGAKVNLENLYLLQNIIEEHFKNNLPILVHCKGGIERSPLTVVNWLVAKHGLSFDEAYAYTKSKRHVIEDRRIWM